MAEASKSNWWGSKGPNSDTETVRELVNIDNEAACIKYQTRLAVEQNSGEPFPTSDAPKNPILKKSNNEAELQNEYIETLAEYRHEEEFSPSKCDIRKGGAGHKFHLNVAPENAKAISEYLIKNGYCHKFLSGGEVLNGKIFTIYIGSRDLANKLAQELSMDLQGYLNKPITEEEIEYAPNVIGRFTGDIDEFQQYGLGLRGITIHRDWADKLTWCPEEERRRILPLALRDSYNALANRYGSYFYGSD